MFLCPKAFGRTFLHAETSIGKIFSVYLFKYVLHFHGKDEPFSPDCVNVFARVIRHAETFLVDVD